MAESKGAEPKRISYSEAVKLAKRKAQKGLERNDLLVRDKVLELHWHWSRDVGVPRDEAIDRAVNLFFEEVIIVGDEDKTNEKRKVASSSEPLVGSASVQPAAPASPVVVVQSSSPRPVLRALPFAEVFLATMTIVLALFITYTRFELFTLLAANGALTAAAVAGRVFLRR